MAANIDSVDSNTPLFIACQLGNLHACRSLLKAGANINTAVSIPGCKPLTPLLVAACAGLSNVFRELVSHGADANSEFEGKTAHEWLTWKLENGNLRDLATDVASRMTTLYVFLNRRQI